MTTKVCTKCGEEKPADQFYPRYRQCRPCKSAWDKEYYGRPEVRERRLAESRRYRECHKDTPQFKQRARAAHFKNLYGITPAQYDEMVVQQQGCCAICLQPPLGDEPLCVDHCHDTGTVRGLLHRKCNAAIGLLGDSVEGVGRALSYLQRTDAQ